MMADLTIEIPLRITISTGPMTSSGAAPAMVPTLAATGLERVDIDSDYSNRKGYDPNFLGVEVAVPTLTEDQRRNAAKNSLAKPGEDNTLIPYHHFSVVMSRRRQLAYYTVVNIHGAQSRSPQRSGDRWYYDPRIAESEQIGEDLYARNALDRGHLVRRLDPAWGSASAALKANNDTFHFTNCSPQHAGFNQSSETWQGIENFLLNHATAGGKKLTIFTGPVLAENDPLYRGVRLPVRFWKIAAFTKADGSLSVTAYLLDQEELIAGLERFDADTFQVTVAEISERTGLDFSYLSSSGFEANFAAQSEGLERSSGMPRRNISRVSQIVA
jgi:endonuclease G